MQNSLLEIEKIVFPKVLIEAQVNQDPETPPKVDCRIDVFHHDEDKTRWMVALQVLASSGKATTGYSVDVHVVGEYRVDTKLSQEAINNLIQVNGPSILYSSARELILTITSRGPNPGFLLPSKTFIDRKTPQTKEPPSKPKRMRKASVVEKIE